MTKTYIPIDYFNCINLALTRYELVLSSEACCHDLLCIKFCLHDGISGWIFQKVTVSNKHAAVGR